MSEAMIDTDTIAASEAEAARRRVVEDLRRANDLLCLWRVCCPRETQISGTNCAPARFIGNDDARTETIVRCQLQG